MRVAQVIYRALPPVGGMEVYAGELGALVRRLGHEHRVYQATGRARASRAGPRSGEGDSLSAEVRQVRSPRLLPKLLGFGVGLLADRGEIRREDLLLVHNPEPFPSVSWHPRVLVISHGATWTHEANRLRRWMRRTSAAWALRAAWGMVFNDSFALRELGVPVREAEGMFTEVRPRRWFIPNCVDTQVFLRLPPREPWSSLHPILVPRNFTAPRGIDLAIRAFARFAPGHPEATLLLGGGPIEDMPASRHYARGLRDLVADLGLGERVRFLGRVPRAEMAVLYSSSCVTVIPSRASEGTSLAALESMACGTATVATAVEGLRDLPAVHCEATAEGLAGALEEVYGAREAIGGKQAEAVRSTFTRARWERCWGEVLTAVGREAP